MYTTRINNSHTKTKNLHYKLNIVSQQFGIKNNFNPYRLIEFVPDPPKKNIYK